LTDLELHCPYRVVILRVRSGDLTKSGERKRGEENRVSGIRREYDAPPTDLEVPNLEENVNGEWKYGIPPET